MHFPENCKNKKNIIFQELHPKNFLKNDLKFSTNIPVIFLLNLIPKNELLGNSISYIFREAFFPGIFQIFLPFPWKLNNPVSLGLVELLWIFPKFHNNIAGKLFFLNNPKNVQSISKKIWYTLYFKNVTKNVSAIVLKNSIAKFFLEDFREIVAWKFCSLSFIKCREFISIGYFIIRRNFLVRILLFGNFYIR